jgi:hypothetical protein
MAVVVDPTAVVAVDSMVVGVSMEAVVSAVADIPVSTAAGDRMAAGRIAAGVDSHRGPMEGLHIEVLDSVADRLRLKMAGVSALQAAPRGFAMPRTASGIPLGAPAA